MRTLSPLLLTLMLLLTGCFSASPALPAEEPVNEGRTEVLPLSGLNHYTEGTPSLSFELPSDVDYQPVSSRAGPDSVLVRTWRAPVEGGDCIVIAGEQPDFRGAFPAAAIAAFAAGRERGGAIELNEAAEAVPGTVAGVSQRSRYPIDPGNQFGPQGMLFVSQYLTEESTLISLNVAGPSTAVESCRLAEIASTLQPARVTP
jgi:hypothetical protein